MITKETLDMLGEAALRYGIQGFECADFKVMFSLKQPQLVFEPRTQPIGEKYGMPTDDELLFASSLPLSEEEIAARPPA